MPVGLAFDAAGNLYAANQNSNTIEKFTPGGRRQRLRQHRAENAPGLAFDAAGNLYAANSGNNTIEKFTPDGVGSVFATSSLLSGPGELTIDAAGTFTRPTPITTMRSCDSPRGVSAAPFNNGDRGEARALGLAFQATTAAVPEPSASRWWVWRDSL